jgi:hypothetical protein
VRTVSTSLSEDRRGTSRKKRRSPTSRLVS